MSLQTFEMPVALDDVIEEQSDHDTVVHDEARTEVQQPVSDPETQAAIDDLATVGIEVGEPKPQRPPSEAELQAKAEADFRGKFMAASEMLVDAVLERRKAEAVFKTAKAKEKCCAEMLEQLADRGPERLPLFEAAEREQARTSINDSKVSREKADDGWKLACVTELDLPKGITVKLIDDGIDTIGRLEQRRADITMKREKWPAGVGKAAIDKIENAVLIWLENNQPIETGPEVPDEAAAAEEATTDHAIDPEIGGVEARLEELYGDVDFKCERTNGSYGSGRQAYERGDLLTDCPLTPSDEQDQWLMGWADAKEADRELE